MNNLSLGQNQVPVLKRLGARMFSAVLFGSTALLGMYFAAGTTQAQITEPETVFYGKIINRTSGQEYLMNKGTLTWTVVRPDGQQTILTTTLQPLNAGEFSYQLLVPHEALTYGITNSSSVVPLPPQQIICTNIQLSVDGSAASIMAPGSASFAVSQSLRASTYRLDLEVGNALPDSVGDGIPDWWKNRFGIVDPNADPDGDGWSNLQEFWHGSNPNQDNRIPTLATDEVFVYADGTTGIRLNAIDSDSQPTNILYTLTSLPRGGTFYLRNAVMNSANSDAALTNGSVFTQDDINKGRLVFVSQTGSNSVASTSFGVSLHDENLAHQTNAVVNLNAYRPVYPGAIMQLAQSIATSPAGFTALAGLSVDEQQMVLNYFLSRDQGYTIWDASRASAAQELLVASSNLSSNQYAQFISSFGRDRKNVLVGGAGGDHLVGGMENDILVGGRGNDTLRGNAGSDLFLFNSTSDGNDIIKDFNTAENDAIDISRILTGTSNALTNYVQITSFGTNSYIGINYSGTGTVFTNLVLTLLNTHFTQADLGTLVNNGNLITGDKVMAPTVSIVASTPAASKNGPIAGQLTLTRTGATNLPLMVNLQITGSAVNGTDYQYLAPQVSFNPGDRSVNLQINPYVNSVLVTQVVQVALMSGSGYAIGNSNLAQVTIEPLAPQITIEAVEPVAVKGDQTPGTFLITRGGAIDRSVLVRLIIGGTAVNGTDYTSISSLVNFAPQQTTALLTITPKTTAVLNGMKYVQLTVKADPTYKVFSPSVARVSIVDQLLTLAQWQQNNFPGSTNNWQVFASQDTGNTGIKNIYRYAFGLNPQNPQSSKGLPTYQIVNNHLVVTYKQPASVSDIDYIVEVSDDLVSWRSSSVDVEPLVPSLNTNDVESVSFRSTKPVQGSTQQYMRVSVVPQ
jgi:RTX calcium-binding nonapeptide repeat (4 copies)/Cadherin-like/Calx-beta domain